MSLARLFAPVLAVALVAAGCATAPAEDDLGSSASAVQLSGVKFLGKLVSGETRSGQHQGPPAYFAYGFDVRGGDRVRVEVRSIGGDSIAYLTDKTHNILAQNDDVSATSVDSRVEFTVPRDSAPQELRVAFKDVERDRGSFVVKLTLQSAAPEICTYEGEGYPAGASFAAKDDCNTCTCAASGSVTCTTETCTCDPASEPYHHYLGSPRQCLTLHYTCPAGEIPFANTCGCGCKDVD